MAKKPHTLKKTPENLQQFLATLAATCNVSEAARAIGISRWLAYDWKRQSEDGDQCPADLLVALDEDHVLPFHEAWEDALGMGRDELHQEMWRRGVRGYEEPVVHQGVISHRLNDDLEWVPVTIRKYSDNLLLALAKAHMPEKFRENHKVEHEVGQGGVLLLPANPLDPEEWAKAVAKHQAKARGEAPK